MLVMREVPMDRKNVIATVASGAACALLVLAFTQQVSGEAARERAEALERYGGEQVEVCVATSSISAGEMPTLGNTATQLWVSGLLPEDPVTSLSQVADKPVTTSIVKGEVLSLRHFDAAVSSVDVPEGLCALSVPAEDVKAVGGAISSGSHVDVYLSGGSGVSLLSRDTLVLATSAGGDESSSAKAKIAWITLAVPPDSVQEFLAAADKGSLHFVLPGKKPADEASGASEASGGSSEPSAKPDEASKKKEAGK